MTDDKAPTEFQLHTRNVVGSFLRSAVVLDDLAEMGRPSVETTMLVPSAGIVAPDYPSTSATSGDIPQVSLQGVGLNADAVIKGFADIGSVCAVLRPEAGEEFRDRTVRAAQLADIVILDWKIHESAGDAALGVMRHILQKDRKRLRLMAIYTGEPDLHGIFDRVKGVAGEFYEDDELVEKEGLRISKGPLHIVVLAKQGTLNDQRQELNNQEVTEHQLADRLADDFALMIGGLIQNCAIAGIVAIRDQAHRILAKFEESLDPAYLGHRLLLPHPPDAEDHLVEALGSELLSVLEENHPGGRADWAAIEAWLEKRQFEGLKRLDDTFPGMDNALDGWKDLFSKGIEGAKVKFPQGSTKKKMGKQATELFAEDAESAVRSDRSFAALLCLKTRYPGRPPRLSIGTLLHTRASDEVQYFLCLQPKCDSVRLTESTGFPLIPLTPLRKEGVHKKGTSLVLALETSRDNWEEFGIKLKPSDLSIRFFEPNANPPGEVVAKEEQNGNYFFEDVEGTRYRWIADMKDEHALQIAAHVASALARPGPNHAEWLRRAVGAPQ